MAGNILLEVVTPEKAVLSEKAQMVVAPGTLGDFGVLPGHTSFMSTLKTGTLRYTDEKGSERLVFVSGGFAEALPDKITVLAESAEKRSDISLERAQSALDRAQKRLEQKQQDIDYIRARAALERALHRIKLASAK